MKLVACSPFLNKIGYFSIFWRSKYPSHLLIFSYNYSGYFPQFLPSSISYILFTYLSALFIYHASHQTFVFQYSSFHVSFYLINLAASSHPSLIHSKVILIYFLAFCLLSKPIPIYYLLVPTTSYIGTHFIIFLTPLIHINVLISVTCILCFIFLCTYLLPNILIRTSLQVLPCFIQFTIKPNQDAFITKNTRVHLHLSTLNPACLGPAPSIAELGTFLSVHFS